MIEISYLQMFIFITLIWILVRFIIAIRFKKFSVKRELQMLLVYICLVVIARFVYFPLHFVDGKIGTLTIGFSTTLSDMISLIPFFFLFDRYDGWLINIIGNIAMFIPVGIREGLPSLNDTSIDYVIQKNKRIELEKVIMEIVKNIMSNDVDVDLKRDSLVIENLREFIEKDNSILLLNPKISEEWNYEKNGDLKPEYFAPNSGKIVWWKCRKEHEWQSRINNRNRGIGCPYCSGRNAVKGVNDLQTVDSTLSKEWNYEKNVGLTPSDVLPNSEIKVWWKCQNGHEWQAMIGNRTKGQGCPYCSGRKVLKGFNDLQTVMPDLAREWHPSKNRDLKPCDVTRGSNKKVWWKCLKGHEWQATVGSRSKGAGCPYCSSRKVLNGFNDLQSANPDLAKEWNYEKNSGLTPAEVTPNSRKSIWWKCSACNYEWKTSVSNRNNQNTGCPKCSKKKTAQALSHRVIQLSLDYKVIAEYSSLMEAEKQTGIRHGDISRVCSGKRRTAGGYMWKYIEQD